MKINGLVLPGITVTEGHAIDSSGSVLLEEGQVINARVLSYENGNGILKAEEGYILRAKLDTGVILEQGSDVSLIVVGNDDGVLVLKIYPVLPNNQIAELEPLEKLLSEGLPERLVRLISMLNIPATKEFIGHIQNLIKQNPQLSYEKIVFLAANGFESKDAESIFDGNIQMGQMLRKLLRFPKDDYHVFQQGFGNTILEKEKVNSTYVEQQTLEEQNNSSQSESSRPVSPKESEEAPLHIIFEKPAEQGKEFSVYIKSNLVQQEPKEKNSRVSFRDSIDILDKAANSYDKTKIKSILGENVSSRDDMAVHSITSEKSILRYVTTGLVETESKVEFPNDIENKALDCDTPESQLIDDQEVGIQRVLMSLLSQMPALKNIQDKDMGELSSIILRAFSQLQEFENSDNDIFVKLRNYLKDVFINLTDNEGGKNLKWAWKDLYTRLSLLKKMLSEVDINGRTEILEQTQKLINHMQAINNIEQFAYMQIPVILGDNYSTAELYVFKKKKGAIKIDPENVRILLALDLTNLGHIESLITIKGKEVSLHIEISKDSAEAAFLHNTIKLHDLMAEIGYKFTNLSIKLLKKNASVETALLKLLDFDKNMEQRLDLKI